MPYCIKCGTAALRDATFCHRCGMPIALDAPHPSPQVEPQRLGGWLLAVCILLGGVYPLLYLLYAAAVLEALSSRPLTGSEMDMLLMVAAFSTWSAVAGVGMMVRIPRARGWATSHLSFTLLFSVLLCLFSVYRDAGQSAQAVRLWLLSLLFYGAPWLYLTCSPQALQLFPGSHHVSVLPATDYPRVSLRRRLSRTKMYMNYGTGQICTGEGYARVCS